MVAMMFYTTYARVMITVRAAQARIDAVALAEGQFEIVRNLPFSKIRMITGIPHGVLISTQNM